MGDALEEYVKDAFANTIGHKQNENLLEKYNEVFAYFGNSNNPPDAILKNGDAIEVKKTESPSPNIALNSSPPKHKLYKNDSRITKRCKAVDGGVWEEKDIIYAIGYAPKKNELKHLWFIFGDCYAASKSTYERIEKSIKDGIIKYSGVNLSETNEIGRVNRVDPLGITQLRIRGMWHIQHPSKVFSYLGNKISHFDVDNTSSEDDLFVTCLMRKSKYCSDSIEKDDRDKIECHPNIKKCAVKIKDPDNPAVLINAVLIKVQRIPK